MEKGPSSSKAKEFEFGCIKPTSPSSDPERAVSPADEFFLNGRLLPHSFPIQSRNSTTTRKSSSSSRDSISLVSSSRSSSISSSRSSSSDVAERKAFHRKLVSKEKSLVPNQGSVNNANKSGPYGSPTCKRWQIISIISPVPVLDPSFSRRRRSSGEFVVKLSPKKKIIKESDEEMGFCQRILRSFLRSCKACHAMEEGACVEDHDLDSFVELK